MEKPKLVWLTEQDEAMLKDVEDLRNIIAASHGTLPPKQNAEALGIMTNYLARVQDIAGACEAMRDEYFAYLLRSDDKLAIGRAEAIAKGSEFGQKKTYYERLGAAYQEMVNTFKKIQEYWESQAKNQY